MFHRKPKRFRRRSNNRGSHSHVNGYSHNRGRSNSFSSNQIKNNFRTNQSAEQLIEKYNSLAKEAMSSGDESSCENYLQHADHFRRIIEDKNRNKEQNKIDSTNKESLDNKNISENTTTNQEENTKNKD